MNRNRIKNAKQGGFTLIELVIVITIIGILGAVALPKFVALQTDARIAKLKATRGAVAAGAALVHATYLTRAGVADTVACSVGGTADNLAGGTVCTEGGLVEIFAGYPATPALGTAGIISAAGLSSAVFAPSLTDLNLEGIGAAVNGGTGETTISVIGGSGTSAGVNTTCAFSYLRAVAGAAPTISAMTTSGC